MSGRRRVRVGPPFSSSVAVRAEPEKASQNDAPLLSAFRSLSWHFVFQFTTLVSGLQPDGLAAPTGNPATWLRIRAANLTVNTP
jgi:hypothetical protein